MGLSSKEEMKHFCLVLSVALGRAVHYEFGDLLTVQNV